MTTEVLRAPRAKEWAEINALLATARKGLYASLQLGFLAWDLQCRCGWGDFGKQLAQHCPQVQPRTVYRAINTAKGVAGQFVTFVTNSDQLNTEHPALIFYKALTTDENPALRAEVEAFLEGRTQKQLLLEVKEPARATEPEGEPAAREWCLNIFATHPQGGDFEERWRLSAESGAITWQACKRNIAGAIGGVDPDGNRLPTKDFNLLEAGLKRLNEYTRETCWQRFDDGQKKYVIHELRSFLAGAPPEVRTAAIEALGERHRERLTDDEIARRKNEAKQAELAAQGKIKAAARAADKAQAAEQRRHASDLARRERLEKAKKIAEEVRQNA